MTSTAQINANRENAQHSTGPTSPAGKAISSKNRLTHGLYTTQPYVKPEEFQIYKDFYESMYCELAPQGLLEETLAYEIVGASWRLRRCLESEEQLDYSDESAEKTTRSIERARASAHAVFHRSLNQLRKLQTERAIRFELLNTDYAGMAECKKVEAARKQRARDEANHKTREDQEFMEQLEAYCAPPPRSPEAEARLIRARQLASKCKEANLANAA